MSSQTKWTQKKNGIYTPRNELSIQQQTLLAAVPRWQRQWVKVTSTDGKPSTSTVLVRKWVIDTSAEKEEGTEEEMLEALKVVSSGIDGDSTNLTNGGDDLMSGSATPALQEGDGLVEALEVKVEEAVIAKPHPLTEVMIVDSPPVAVVEPVVVDVDTPMIDEPAAVSVTSLLPELVVAPIEISIPESLPLSLPLPLPLPPAPTPEAVNISSEVAPIEESVDVVMESASAEKEVPLAEVETTEAEVVVVSAEL